MKTEEKTQVSAVGFEPGTFRSCVAHSIHYATETPPIPPIPDVLLVLVAPKYINRNVTTTLQSRFTSSSNVPGSQLGEMALEFQPRDETDVFLLRSTISLTNRRAVGTASLNEMTRNEGADLLYRQRCDITQRSVLLRSDWSSDTRAPSL